MANGLAIAAGGGFGLLDFGMNMFAENQRQNQAFNQWKQEAAYTQRQNQRQALMIKESNQRTAEIYGYQTGRFRENLGLIDQEYNRAGEDLQRGLQSAFAQSAYSRQSQLAALAQATGYNSARGQAGNRSQERSDLLATMGNFGRNQAMEAERLAGVVGQTNRDRAALGRQAKQSVFNAWGDLGVLPELQKYYGQEMPFAPQRQSAWLTGFQALSQGATSGISFAKSLGA